MPQQLIYTSAPRGLVAGRSGHCTVARSAAMREALMLQLEKLSYYQHLSLSGGQERPIHSCRIVEIRGSRYHVLSRIQDAGLDFTGRTNFIAHHLVFTPEEVRQFPSPPVIFRGWTGWLRSWSKEPQVFENEDCSELTGLSGSVSARAREWEQTTGDAINGYGLLESRAGIAFRVDNLAADQILTLFGESLELLELRDPRRDFRATAWQYTFTTSMQEQDNPADFRWRCLHSDNPASNRFAGPDCRPLLEVRALRVTSEETSFARSGRQSPRFVSQPEDVRCTEGDTARFCAKAEGVPSPSYQWFAVDRADNGQLIASATGAELLVPNPPLGVSRYVVRATNSQGDTTSEVGTLSVERKLRLSHQRPTSVGPTAATPASPSYVKSEADIERQRRRIEAQQAQVTSERRERRKKSMVVSSALLLVVALSLTVWSKRAQLQPSLGRKGFRSSNEIAGSEIAAALRTSHEERSTDATKTQVSAQENENSLAQKAMRSEREPTMPPPTSFNVLPSGWMRVEVGTVSNAKAEFFPDGGRFDLYARALGFGEHGDSVWFVYKTNVVGEFHARLTRTDVSSERVCGIMARESQEANAQFVFIGASPTRILGYSRQGVTNFWKTTETQVPAQISPYFRLRTDHTSILAEFSFDHSTWWAGGCLSNALPNGRPIMVGLAACSGHAETYIVAKFVGVSHIGD